MYQGNEKKKNLEMNANEKSIIEFTILLLDRTVKQRWILSK